MAFKWRARRFRVSELMIDFVIVQMDFFYMFVDQLRENCRHSSEQMAAPAAASDDEKQLESGRRRTLDGEFEEGNEPAAQQRDDQELFEQAEVAPLKRVLRLKRLTDFYHTLFMYFYIYELTRYVLIDLLSFELFEHYRLLDCFILGRFRFIGRTNKISSRIVFVFMLTFSVYRILVFNVLLPRFRFSSVEFLMYDYKRALREELRFESRFSQAGWTGWSGSGSESEQSSSRRTCYLDLPNSKRLNPVFYLRSPFKLIDESLASASKKAECTQWILRPNRTVRCWRLLDVYTRLVMYSSVATILFWLALIYHTIGGSILTDLGFELSYPSCASWLQRQQTAALLNISAPLSSGSSQVDGGGGGRLPYDWIYTAPMLLAHQMNIDDIPAIIPLSFTHLSSRSTYHTARILLDILHNNWWYIDFILTVSCVTYIIFISSLDVILNGVEIKRRLETIVEKLERVHERRRTAREYMCTLHDSHQESCEQGQAIYETVKHEQLNVQARCVHKSVEQREREQLADEIATTQALLADHFNLVRNYNQFVSFALTLILAAWCVYSIVISIWMGSVRSTAVEFEFLVTAIGSTFFAVLFFSGAAMARSLNFRLYALIARAMALDEDQSMTKLRWTNIMKFYSPKPKYCFTLLGFAEISSLFCLQFVWWVVSAYIVLAKFFYSNGEQ